MRDDVPLRELHALLAAFIDRPTPGALVVGCADHEMLCLVHTLGQLDTACPADRFLLNFAPCDAIDDYVDGLVETVTAATKRPGVGPGAPITRIHETMTRLLVDLPAGDHRLVVVLAPIRIGDPDGFAGLAELLLAGPFPSNLRIVLRDVLNNPRHLSLAEQSPSHQVLAHRFHMQATANADAMAVARDRSLPPDERAQSLLELAMLAHADGRHSDAVSTCEAAAALADAPQVIAMALAFRADSLHALGDDDAAMTSAYAAVAQASSCRMDAIVHHAAMTLSNLHLTRDEIEATIAWIELAEATAPHNPELQAVLRERRLALEIQRC